MLTIAALTFLFGVALFPNLIHSWLNPDWSLTVYNAASSPKTLHIMFIIALCGLPFVATYTAVDLLGLPRQKSSSVNLSY